MVLRLETVTLPRNRLGLSPSAYYNALNRAYRQMRNLLHRDLNDLTSTWANKPVFRFEVETSGADVALTALTDSSIWHWLDRGVRRHYIFANPDKPMIFKGWSGSPPYPRTWNPATRPGSLYSGFSNPEYDTRVSTFAIDHPGIKARRFSEQIIEKRRRDFHRLMLQALLPLR